MAVKILRHGNRRKVEILYEFTCPTCGCQGTFEPSDLSRDRDGEYIICPECGKFIDKSSDAVKLHSVK